MFIIDFLLNFLKDPLTVIQDLIVTYDTLIYVILFLVVFVETGFVIMPLLPGDSMLFAIGVIAATTGQLNIAIVIPLLITAALLGDNLNYFIGKKFGSYIKEKQRILFLKKEYIVQTELFFEKNGVKAIILARFMPIIRTIAPFVAGAGSMKYKNYIINCIIGATLWVTSITFLGYFLGQISWVKHNFEKVVLAIIILSILPLIIKLFKKK
ncbi:VTT domain-containing protein [uncultured Flavobacterium sp.]|uniref:VTT domain-containing protein n=1 Tax=uncultured Flavobacterium sp. TaxID=165435 RepID=UPI0030CA5897